jgi:iron complex transport system permease protein
MVTPDFAFAATHKPGHVTIRNRWFAVRVNTRVLGMCLLTLGMLAVLTVWAMTLGSYHIAFVDVVKSVFGRGAEQENFIVQTLRLPRVLSTLLIGAVLAMSGAIFQGLVRNALVSPDIIGINTGASLMAVIWIAYGLAQPYLPLAAFLGAIVTATAIYLISWKGGIVPGRMILVGIGIGAFLSAATTWVTLQFPIERIRPAIVWTMGSVYGSSWADVRLVGISLLALGPLAVVLMWYLRVLQLGDDIGRGLGMHLELTRLAMIVVGCGLAAVAVAVAGPIGFVALMIPHAARMLAGPLSGSVMLFTGLLGATFLLFADVAAQHFLPVVLPVGVMTAAIGAPYFLFLLYRSNARV